MKLKAGIPLLFILILAFVYSCSTSTALYAKEKVKKRSGIEDTVILTVKSKPPGATVIVDRVIRGVTPIKISLHKGKHLVRVAIDQNWRPHIEQVDIVKDTSLDIELYPATHFSYERGKKAYESANFDAAREHFTQVVSGSGKVIPDAYFYLALLARRKSDYNAMEKYLKKFVDNNPQSGDFVAAYPLLYKDQLNYGVKATYYLLGEIYQNNYKWGSAATAYKLSIPDYRRFLDPKLKPTYQNIKKLRKLTNKDPGDFRSHIRLGYLYEMKGNLFQSMLAYRDGVQSFFKKSPDFMKKYGKILELK